MDRRKLLLVVAVIIAALGTGLVYLYVQGADDRATEQFDGVTVLTATASISTGESIEAAVSAGKIGESKVSRSEALPDSMTETSIIAGMSATTTIYPGEQIIASKFTQGVVAAESALTIPDGMTASSIQLDDPSRVAGFVNPGSHVTVYVHGGTTDATGGVSPYVRKLFDDVTVIGVGSTTPVSTTTTTEAGATTTEELPRTLLTLALDQKDSEKLQFAAKNLSIYVSLRNDNTKMMGNAPTTLADLWKN